MNFWPTISFYFKTIRSIESVRAQKEKKERKINWKKIDKAGMSSNKRLGSPIDRESAKEMRTETSQTSLLGSSTLGDSTERMSTTSGMNPESSTTGLFKGVNEGAWRESFVVDVLEMDGQKFMGSLTRKEMSTSIYIKALGLRPENLHGFVPGYKGHPTIKFRLKEKINVDLDLQGKSEFTFDRQEKVGSENIVHTFKCQIFGIRSVGDFLEENQDQRKSRYTWIKVEGAEYELPKEEIVEWLAKFGTPITELTEDKERDSSDSDENEYFNGIYSIKMDLTSKPPQFLPIGGKKIRIYYKGIAKRCVKCFGTGHLKKDCTSPRKDWMEYVSDFMFEKDFDLDMLGDARKYLEKWRLGNKEKTGIMVSLCQERNEEAAEEAAQKLLRRETNKEQIRNITEILHNQSLASGPKPSHSKEKMNPIQTPNTKTPIEEENNAWKLLAIPDVPSSTQTAEDVVKKKRTYIKKNQKSEKGEVTGQTEKRK